MPVETRFSPCILNGKIVLFSFLSCKDEKKNIKNNVKVIIAVKLPTESIPTVSISISIDLHLKILDFLLIFDFPASPYFILLF